MAKRSSSKGSSKKQSPLQRLIYLIVLFLIVVIAAYFGIDLTGTTDTTSTTVPPTQVAAVETPAPGTSWYELYFTDPINSDDESLHHGSVAEQALIRTLDAAQNTIDAALFELNVPDTTAALVRAAERGVKVRIVADDEHNLDDPESTLQEVIDAGAEAVGDDRSPLMHNKFFIIDSAMVWTGSMNITRNDVYNNNNNYILIRSTQMVQNYQNEFDEMFVDGVFNARDDSRPVANPVIEIEGTRIETYFSPEQGDDIEARVAELMRGATKSIRVMAFSFTLESWGNAIIEQMGKGITFQGVFETTGSLQGQMPPIACAGGDVRQDGNPDILHNKVVIIDDEIVVMGSFNFSASARDNNSENLLIIYNPDIARAYTATWQKIFDLGRVPKAEDIDC